MLLHQWFVPRRAMMSCVVGDKRTGEATFIRLDPRTYTDRRRKDAVAFGTVRLEISRGPKAPFGPDIVRHGGGR